MDATESTDWQRRLDVPGLDALGDRREAAIREYRRLLEHLRENADRSEADASLYLRAVDGVSIDELTHFDLMRIARDLDAPITPADSMFLQIAQRRRMKQLGPVPENNLGVSKDSDQIFAQAFDLRVPRVDYVGSLAGVPTHLLDGKVLKPERSSDSRGVFYLFAPDCIRSVQHALTFTSWSDMVEAVHEELGPDFVHRERWQVQELVVEDAAATPARDLKFYSFYGEIGMIVEASRHTNSQYQFILPDGTVAAADRDFYPEFDDPSMSISQNGGIREDYLAEVRELSRQIPVPYMRIDYLNGVDGLIFNEMSSAPGRSHTWPDEFDRRLGTMYHEAQIRLLNDLLDGKEFARYQRFRRLHRDQRRRSTHSSDDVAGTAASDATASTVDLVDPTRPDSVRGRPMSRLAFGSDEVRRWDRTLERSGLDELLDDRAWSLERHRDLLEHLRRRSVRSDLDAELYLRAIDAASIDELTHVDLVTVGRSLGADLTTADSFFRAIALRRRKKQLGSIPERSLGSSRTTDQLLASVLNIRVPEVYYTGSLNDVPTQLRSGTVLEQIPQSGSKGAYHLIATDRIHSLENGHELTGWSAMIDSIDRDLGPTHRDNDTWQVREFIGASDGTPAHALKFYAFYGEIGLIREASGPRGRECQYFDADGTIARCGRSHEPRMAEGSSTIETLGRSGDWLDPVRALSREVPAPFMCLDYLDGADGFVFLGMSSAPGMAHTFNDEYDRRLGRMYSEAEIRLTNDLLDHVPFRAFHRFVRIQAGSRATPAGPPAGRRAALGRRVTAMRRRLGL